MRTDVTIPKYDEMHHNMTVKNISENSDKYILEGIPDSPEMFKMKYVPGGNSDYFPR